MKRLVLVLDCGATNVKACLVDETGNIVATHSMPNETIPDPEFTGGLIWDVRDIWKKMIICIRKVCNVPINKQIAAVTVTSFGVDGAPMKKDGSLCYPAISWQCKRTEESEKSIGRYFDPEWLYKTTGLQSYHFNTINKLIWFKENRPEVLECMDYYVFMPSIFLYFMTGEFITDATMAGTSMLTDIKNRKFSAEIFNKLGITQDIFPYLVEPGAVVGKINNKTAYSTGLPVGIPVIASGHDTQFAILG